MRHPPPLSACWSLPITTCIAGLAIVAFLRSSGGTNIGEQFMFNAVDWWREPWRLVTPALFHGDIIHLLFNLCWLWVFGTLVEAEFGHAPTLGIFLLLAAGSEAAEYAVFGEGIGLSGVNYGLFGLLWVLSRRDRRFYDAVDRQTVQLMVGWFFLCIVLTIAKVWSIANVAHGAASSSGRSWAGQSPPVASCGGCAAPRSWLPCSCFSWPAGPSHAPM